MKRNHLSSIMLTVCLCWMPLQFVFAQNATGQTSLYDNMELLPISNVPGSDWIGPRVSTRRRNVAQQFVMGDSDNVSSISLFLNRVGGPQGEVGVEIWENGESGVPSSLVTTVGTIDLRALSSRPEEVTFETLVTGLSPNARYHVVLNNENTTISSIQNSYRMSLLGRPNDEQSEGTNGAARILSSSPTMFNGEWRPYADALDRMGFGSVDGCYRGNCANYLRMRVTAAALLGDFDQDGSLDADDIDQLSLQLRTTPDNRSFDLNNDSTLSQADREVWVHDLANTYFGDSNLDSEFNSSDLTAVFQAAKYELDEDAGWAEGDWNGDGRFDTSDLTAAFQDGGYEIGPRVAVSAVPEPSSAILLAIGIIVISRLDVLRSVER